MATATWILGTPGPSPTPKYEAWTTSHMEEGGPRCSPDIGKIDLKYTFFYKHHFFASF